MAIYHLTLKKDIRPDGSRISPVSHTDYINRDKRYKDYDEKDRLVFENYITSPEKEDACGGKYAKLYSSPYGDIDNTTKGLQVKGRASLETIAIGLMVAKDVLGDKLTINGSDHFKDRCVDAAVLAELSISFTDAKMQSSFEEKKRRHDHGKRELEERGVLRRQSGFCKPNLNEFGGRTLRTLAERQSPSLRELSERHLDGHGAEDASVLLQTDDDGELDEPQGEGQDGSRTLRRNLPDGRDGRRFGAHGEPDAEEEIRRIQETIDFPRNDDGWARRRMAERTARAILKNVEMYGDEVLASSHVEYINREKAFKKRGGCVYKGHRLPKWANDSPNAFFQEADKHSPSDVRRYLELEFALPNELTLEQNVELIHTFIEKELPHNYYTFAIHDKIGALSEDTHNLHCHLMFSPRIIDDIEAKHERGKTIYFKYPLRRNAKNQSEKNRRAHGAPIDRKWAERGFLKELRKDFADVVNGMLERYGHVDRVDHRTLKSQREEALRNGDVVLAEILNRFPEAHMRPKALLEEVNPEVEALKAYRLKKDRYQKLLLRADELQRKIREKQVQQKADATEDAARSLMQTDAYAEGDVDKATLIGELKDTFLSALDAVEKAKQYIIKEDDAMEMARFDYMTDDERDAFLLGKHYEEQHEHWMTFLRDLKIPEDATDEERAAYAKLGPAVKEKLESLDTALEKLQPTLQAIEKRLQGKDLEKKIAARARKISFDNRAERSDYQQAYQELQVATSALTQALFEEDLAAEKKDSYTAKELYAILRRRFFGLRKEVQKLTLAVQSAKKAVISPERAQKMAENEYTKGSFKELRTLSRTAEKKRQYLAQDLAALEKKQALLAKGKPDEFASAEDIEAYGKLPDEIAKLEKRIADGKAYLAENEPKIAAMEEKLAAAISTPEAKAKIEEIKLGILQKNMPKVRTLEKLQARLVSTKDEMEKVRVEMRGVKAQMARDKSTTQYRLAKDAKTGGGGGGAAVQEYAQRTPKTSILADAILGDPRAVCISLRSREDDDGLRNWDLMSELDKDEERMKQVWRDI